MSTTETRHMTSRLGFKFPSPGRQRGQMAGGGGMLKLRFDQYITYSYAVIEIATKKFDQFYHVFIRIGFISAQVRTFKGLYHPMHMRSLMRSTLKSLTQLLQINTVGEFRKLFHPFESSSSSESWLNVLFTNVL